MSAKRYQVLFVDLIDDEDDGRKVLVTLENGTKITIEPYYESFVQYGGTNDELWSSIGVAYAFTDWLHGGDDFSPVMLDYLGQDYYL